MEREGAEVPAPGRTLEARTSFYGTEDPSCRTFHPEGPAATPNKPTGWERAYLRVRKQTPLSQGERGREQAKRDRRGMPGADAGLPNHHDPPSYPSCTSMQVPPPTIPPIHVSPHPALSFLSISR